MTRLTILVCIAAQATGQTCEWFVSESLEIANRLEKAIRDLENNNA